MREETNVRKILAVVVMFLVLAAASVMAGHISQSAPTKNTVDLVSANTQYALVMTGEVTTFSFQCRQAYDIRYAFVTGKVATPVESYTTLKSGSVETFSDISWTNPTLYLACSTAGVSVEVQYETQP